MDLRTPPPLRLGLVALCVALCAATPRSSAAEPNPEGRRWSDRAAEGRDGERRSSEDPERPRPHQPKPEKSKIPWWAVVVGVAAVGCAATDCLDAGPRAASGPSRRDLLENGPQAPMVLPEGAFPVYGFIHDGWPIVADYRSQADSVTWLTVSVPGRPVWSRRLPSGEHQVKVIYEDGDAPRSVVALIALESRSATGGNDGVPTPIEVFGLGAGPRAVGSVAINSVSLAPSGRQLGGDFARFGYVAASDFNAIDMEILRFAADSRNGRRVITATTVAQYRVGAVRRGAFGPRMWDGREQKSQRASEGRHRLQVRGWEVEGDESWVTALSPTDLLAP